MAKQSVVSPVKYLLVDDVEENLIALEAILAREDLELLKASSGTDALELLLENDVALALIDVQMPEMDGFELAELMRGIERTRHVPIIFITAGMHEGQRVFQGYDAGAVDFLFKPIEARILRHKADTFFQLARQRQALAETLRLNEELLAVVGHDLRNPLEVILMTAELLRQSNQNPEILKSAERLHRSGTRMREIINELLDLSRARLGGGIPIEPRAADLAQLMRAAVAEAEAAHPERRVKLRAEGDLRGHWDPARLEQVLSNLLGNAVRHGTPDNDVEVKLEAGQTDVTLTVHNAGHIPPELLPRIFQPFQTSRESRAKAGGLGLGLYIVEQIVLAHEGTIEVSSNPGQGTTFRVRLPRIATPKASALH